MAVQPSAASLSAADLALFASDPAKQIVPAGTVLIREGEPGTHMIVLLDGEVAITFDGRPLDYLEAGTMLGEMAMVDDQPRSASATAATDCCIVPIDRQRFHELVRQSPEFASSVMTIMSLRLRRLVEVESRRQRMEEELEIGRRIQLSMLPTECPIVPGWEFAAYYQAAREVGGDLYDFTDSPQVPGKMHVAIADVTGKGVPAALYMAVSRTILRTEALDDHAPAAALERVSRFIRQDVQSPLFLSAFFMTIDTKSGRVCYANGGHNPPYWYHGAEGTFEALSARGIVLGAFEGLPPEEAEFDMLPGDLLVLFTDGVTEARSPTGDFYDEERLEEVIGGNVWQSADELLKAVVDSVTRFVDTVPFADDVTIVVLRRLPQ